ncbi:hypothetical protein [Streptomyces sp. NPDC006463]|uniref:hypothetical protein n=1 Tax=Streptomyces sp. NPDC006463 TaxID=3364746 RepID=UPI0036A71002
MTEAARLDQPGLGTVGVGDRVGLRGGGHVVVRVVDEEDRGRQVRLPPTGVEALPDAGFGGEGPALHVAAQGRRTAPLRRSRAQNPSRR